MSFDERMKRRAGTETCPLPEGFQGRLEGKIQEITEKGRGGKRRVFRTFLLAAALSAILGATALAASPTLRQALTEALGSFAPYSQKIEGLSAEDRGIEVRMVSALTDGNMARIYYEVQDLTEDRLDGTLQVEWESVIPDDRANWAQWGYSDDRLVGYDPDSRTALMEFGLIGYGEPVDDTVLAMEICGILTEKGPVEGNWTLNVPLTTAPDRKVDLDGIAMGKAEAEILRLTPLGAYLETVPAVALPSRREGIQHWPLTVHFSDGTAVAVERADSVYPGYERETYHWTFSDPIDPEGAVGVEINGQYFSLTQD